MRFQNIFLFIVILLELMGSCQPQNYDLAIENVKIFDVHSGQVEEKKTILIKDHYIESIIDSEDKFKANQVINGASRLVTPGFIDTHIHLTSTYGERDKAPKFLAADSAVYYRNLLTKAYMNYGTTTVAVMGQPENWIEVAVNWQKEPSPNYPDIYITGGAMISDESREPYIGHIEVKSPEEAIKKVETYHQLGIQHLKLYWRLREPEMKAVIEKARELNMHLYGHIDNNIISIQKALSMGIKNYEHLLSIPLSVFRYDKHYADLIQKYGIPNEDIEEFIAMRTFMFSYIKENPELNKAFEKLIIQLGEQKATLSTTIHLMGSVAERTSFTTPPEADIFEEVAAPLPRYSDKQKKMLSTSFDVTMEYLKFAHDYGVKIRIGTDCRDGGKALLSEMLLLHEAGFPMIDILQIATINGAEALHINHLTGSVEKGKKADLLIFDQNPFENPEHLLMNKTIIKGGKVLTMN